MIQTIDLREAQPTRIELAELIPRAGMDVATASDTAAAMIADVRNRGESALLDQAQRLDGVRPDRIRIHIDTIGQAVRDLDPAVRTALEESVDRLTQASQAQLPQPTVTQLGPGAQVIQRWKAVDRVGLYVPGGKAVYPSSVLMNVVPAHVAGVSSIALASPAQKSFNGSVHPTILGAAGLLGIEEVYAMGGAGAIGALAYGVLIIADAAADAHLIAVDLVSQAEHDELASAILVTDSVDLADRVRTELDTVAAGTRHSARVLEALNGQQSAIVLVTDLEAAAEFSNAYGPEHLEIQTTEPGAVLDAITNAGAIFLGANSPVSLGDYLAGSNHVLPTGGQSRFSSGLGSYTFVRPQQIINYDRNALETVKNEVLALSDAEDLPAHGEAVAARFRDQ